MTFNNNRIAELPVPILISRISEHAQVKNDVLKCIQGNMVHSMENKHQKIYNTDYFNKSNVNYINILYPYILERIKNIEDIFFNGDQKEIGLEKNIAYWYQQYRKGDYHEWHVHPDCMFASVYYAELPGESVSTEFKLLDKIYKIDVTEGDLITFPSCLLHRSPPNLYDSVKTIVGINF